MVTDSKPIGEIVSCFSSKASEQKIYVCISVDVSS